METYTYDYRYRDVLKNMLDSLESYQDNANKNLTKSPLDSFEEEFLKNRKIINYNLYDGIVLKSYISKE